MMRLFMEVLSMPRHLIVFFPRSLNLDPFLKNSTPGTQSLKKCEIISVVKIWCVCFRAIFQFARSASVRSSHVAFSSRMPCRFGVTQRFWISMFMSFWLIYPMFFCWRHPEFSNPHKDLYLADMVHLNPSGQYLLYRSYRGGVLKAVGLLQKNWPIVFTRVFSHVW